VRILAVRGSNFASLAGQFELDLRQGPLADAHLFVITGPVGAGKSTLLDALSVALFHEAPRLVKASKAKVDELPADDARNLLRRGATEGFAEVDFQADDGRSYRARWEVRRARRRVDGVVQKPSCTLCCLETGESLGGGLTETRAEITRLLGLDFTQFQRAVLLAQGEFASFLQADSNERSALLERMTGTEVYGRVSKAAYERAKVESEKVEAVQRELNALQPVSWEEIVALQGQLEDNDRRAIELEELLRSLHREKDWFARERDLKDALEQARKEQTEVLAQESTFEEQRNELRRTESAVRLSAYFSAVDELKAQAETLSAGLEAQREAARQAMQARNDALALVDAARATVSAAEASRRDIEPQLEEALKVDEQLRAAEQAVTEADKRRQVSDERRVAGEESLRSSRELLSGLRKTEQELEEFKAANSGRAPIFTEQKHWLEQILQYEKVKEEEIKNRDAAASLARTIEDLRKKSDAVSGELSSEHAEIERLEAASAALEAEIAALGPEHLEQVQEESRSRQEQAAALEKSHVELRSLQAEVHRILTERAEAVRESATARHLAAETDSRLPALEAATAEAERAWRMALSSRKPNVEELRSQLSPGQPCPVCGALDHPWVSVESPILDELVEKSGKRREELANDLAVLRGRRAQQDARLEQLQKSIVQADKRLDSLTPERERLRTTIVEGARKLGLADLAEVSKTLAAAKSQLDLVARELRAARDKQAVLRSTMDQLKSRKRVFEKHNGLHSTLETNFSVALSREESTTAQLAVIQASREKLRTTITSAFSCFPDPGAAGSDAHAPGADSAGPGFDLALLDDRPETLRRTFASRADEWKKKLEQLGETCRQISAVEVEVEYRERESVQAATEYEAAEASLLARKRDASELAGKRALLLDGRAVADVRRFFDDQVDAARTALQSAERGLEAATADLNRLETTIGSQMDQLKENSDKLHARTAALHKQLNKRGFEEDDARRLASRGESWCQDTRDAIDEYDKQRARVRERVEERERQVDEHGRARPSRNAADVDQLMEDTAEQRKTVDRVKGEIGAQLIHAQSVKERMKALSDQLISLEGEGRVWLQLGEVIGSADGKAFRNFAQTYTLDLLLEHANGHLADLKPRYRLERLPNDGHDPLGILVVDQDMGDDRRPVNTLSGGETFLVSLALALGLSSLQSHRVRLGSLFIDEGLGALDSAALETALAALEALQLQDRQIGIISHVDGLAEHFQAEVRVVPLGAGASRVEVAKRG